VILLGVGGISILEHLNGPCSMLVLVDAVRFGSAAGTVHRNTLDSLPPTHHGAVSVHGLGIRELIDAGRILYPDRMPQNIVCIGIEGENFNQCGAPLSGSVQGAIRTAVEMICETLEV
jgi:hydrogenase maturation protease